MSKLIAFIKKDLTNQSSTDLLLTVLYRDDDNANKKIFSSIEFFKETWRFEKRTFLR